ncbi:MAG TPA: glycoside hydrolase family 15 protein [Chthoniobacterales bacterium]|nr:glycoside hydrolase family 15 protein [Chthoniobacterales bacterium]
MPAEYPIADYALIGNCETAALVNSDGGIDWLCLPAFDAPSFFGALIDRDKGGEFIVRPTGEYRVARTYRGDTAILETRFSTPRGTVLLTDFFVVARERTARFYDFTSLHPTRKLVRLVELESGEPVEMEVRVAARPDYARREARWEQRDGGFASAETRIFSNMPLQEVGDLFARFFLERGRRFHLVLDYSDQANAPDERQIDRWLNTTQAFWEEWNLFNYYRGRHSDVVRRSAVTLKLLTYAPTGAFVAAPTTSLPEKIGGDANWDYRFTWLRDTSLFINALFRIGYSGEAKAYLEYLAKHCGYDDATELPVLWPVREETDSAEEILEHLSGYRGSQPVRRGNRAHAQLQLDNSGHMLQSLLFWKHTGGKLDRRKRNLGCAALQTVRREWRQPDNGIWEVVERRQFTYGKVSAWLAIMRARDLGLIDKREADRLADEVRNHTLEHGVRTEEGVEFLSEAFESERLDASSLLAYNTGFLADELARSTRERIEERLGTNGWLHRSDDDAQAGEGAFILCSFWLIEHLVREGKIARAERLLETIIARASPLGLYSEQFKPATGEFLGNFPQAFSHLGLITAILNVERAKKDRHFARMPEHEKFRASVGAAVGFFGVIAGFWRVPKTFRLLFSSKSKWCQE